MSQIELKRAEQCLENGDFSNAVAVIQRYANSGNAHAQYLLGKCYYNGYGLKKSVFKAINMYEKAAAQNDPDGIRALAHRYRYGEGVEKNKEKALELYARAAKLGDDEAEQQYHSLQREKKALNIGKGLLNFAGNFLAGYGQAMEAIEDDDDDFNDFDCDDDDDF